VEQRRQLGRRIALHRRQDVPVDPEGDFHPLVAEPLRDDVCRHAGREQQGRRGVPQPVELDRTHVRGLHDACELTLTEIIDLQRKAERILTGVQVAPFP